MPRITTGGILKELRKADDPVLETLEKYRAPSFDKLWQRDQRLYRIFSKKLISADHPARGFELAQEGLAYHPSDRHLEYLRALSLARSGNTSRAMKFVDELLKVRRLEVGIKVETLSLKGRLYKDLFQRTRSVQKRKERAELAARFYRKAFDLKGDSFPAINAATMSLLAGRHSVSKKLARSVIRCVKSESSKGLEDYWLLATLGEAYVLVGNNARAYESYARAMTAATKAANRADIAAMRRQLLLLKKRIPVDDRILSLFDLGSIAVFAGHLLDHPEKRRGKPRFPNDPLLVRAVAKAIREKLEELDIRVGFSSVACGADVLFCEELLDRNGVLHAVLPFDLDDFYATSVDFGRKDMVDWRRRCDRVLKRAEEVHHATTEKYLNDELLFQYANSYSQGLAIIRARRMGVEPVAICVLDPGDVGSVGTADFLEQWDLPDRSQAIIDLAEIRATIPHRPATRVRRDRKRPLQQATNADDIKRQRRAMLFADVKNFSKLEEHRTPDFFVSFLNEVSEVINPAPTLFQNTWGDGLYAVFRGVLDCAETALNLLRRVEQVDFEEIGLPPDTTIRIGLHSGPVYQSLDKIIRRRNFFGSHVIRAARIEPVTTPGCIFTSEQFAAELAVLDDDRFQTEFVGVERLAKDFDKCALYRLRDAGDR